MMVFEKQTANKGTYFSTNIELRRKFSSKPNFPNLKPAVHNVQREWCFQPIFIINRSFMGAISRYVHIPPPSKWLHYANIEIQSKHETEHFWAEFDLGGLLQHGFHMN